MKNLIEKRKMFLYKNTNLINNKNTNGITLIALVITIVVLLILAVVTIATLIGDNGIITKAQEAKTETEESKDDELRKLTQAEAATHFESYEYTDVSGEKINIPAKCAVSQVEGENTLENGLVIIDANGNEWVWIEVPKEITSEANTDTEIEMSLLEYVNTIINDKQDYKDIWYAYDHGEITSDTENLTEAQKNLDNGCGLTYDEYNSKKSLMLQSIKNNGGFYIGRYEVGYELKEGENVRNYGTDYTGEHSTEQTPVIKANMYPYNWVRCNQAEKLAESFNIKDKTSSLMFGIQWDLVIKFLEEKNAKTPEELITDSSKWANYSKAKLQITNSNAKQSTDRGATYSLANSIKPENSEIVLSTGASNYTKVLNIYDLAGNMWERTLEKSSSWYNLCSVRGGSFRTIQMYSMSTRSNDGITYSTSDIGFRVTIY